LSMNLSRWISMGVNKIQSRRKSCHAFTSLVQQACFLLHLLLVRASDDVISRYYKAVPGSRRLPSSCNFSASEELIVSVNPSPTVCCSDVQKCVSFAVAALDRSDPAFCDDTCQQILSFFTLLVRTNNIQISSFSLSIFATVIWGFIVVLYHSNCLEAWQNSRLGKILIAWWLALELTCLALQSLDNNISWTPGYLDTAQMLQGLQCPPLLKRSCSSTHFEILCSSGSFSSTRFEILCSSGPIIFWITIFVSGP
jgi:hypothetical protein